MFTYPPYRAVIPAIAEALIEAAPSNPHATLVFLGIGESGMNGPGSTSDAAPTGYPPTDRSLHFFNQSLFEQLPVRAQQDPGPAVQIPFISSSGYGYGWCQFALNRLRTDVAPRCIRYVGCGVNGSLSTQWAFNTNPISSFCGAAIANLQAALAEPGTIWAGLLIDQGYNDVINVSAAGWASRWSDITEQLFAYMGRRVPIYFRRMQTDLPTGFNAGQLSTLIAEQDSWASTTVNSVRRPCISPNGMSPDTLHLSTAGNILFGEGTVYDAMVAYPPRKDGPSPFIPSVKMTPTDAGAVAWWKIENAAAASWTDSIGGYALTQSTPSKRPSIVSDAGNGRRALLFSAGAGTSMRFPSEFAALFENSQPFTIIYTFRPVDTAVGMFCGVSSTNLSSSYYQAVGWLAAAGQQNLYRMVSGSQTITQSPPNILVEDVPQVRCVSWGGTSLSVRGFINGMWFRQASDPMTGSLVGLNEGAIGCFTYQGNEAFHVSGYVADIAVFTSQLSYAQSRAVSLYLMDKAP